MKNTVDTNIRLSPSHFNATGCQLIHRQWQESSFVNSMQELSEIALVQITRTEYIMKCYQGMVARIPQKRILRPLNKWDLEIRVRAVRRGISARGKTCLNRSYPCPVRPQFPYPEPVAIQCAWNLDPSVHWNATREKIVGSQCASSGFPVVFQCVPIMQIKTGSPLRHHWVLASASVVPVAFQCTRGSSGLPVWSVQWYRSVLTESGLEVSRSGHFPACDPYVYNWYGELFELNWFHVTCNPKYTKSIMVLISKACTE